ncbi:MAG: phage tail tape measure protein, partial [Desulfobacterales bacterium]|nr:phage tail tape measure protein [Desulfobacterales bacterium]
KAFGKVTGALRNFGLAVGGAAIARNIIGIFSGFQNEAANLASVLGKTRKEITALSDDAKRLGSSTKFTAKEVLKLQTEFAKLGFKEQEILDATEATLSLAAATGTELSEAAAVAGATLGGFGLGAEETQRIVDVMAKSFSTSALDMEKFKESMKGAAPAARAIGLSVEKTTALLGTLASAGISGSKAGNNLKTSFINLNKAGLTLEEGLAKVAKSEDKLSAASDLVGKNAAASFLVLAEGVETTKELEDGLNDAGGAAQKMADEQLNTLTGQTALLTSAWEGFILSLEDGDGAISRVLRGAINLATEFLQALTDINSTQEQIDDRNGLKLAEKAKERELNQQKRLNKLFKLSNDELKEKIKLEGEDAVSSSTILKARKAGFSELTQRLLFTEGLQKAQLELAEKARKEQEDYNNATGSAKFLLRDIQTTQFDITAFTEGAKFHQKEINKLLKSSSIEELNQVVLKGEQFKNSRSIGKLAEKELQRRKDIVPVQIESLETEKETTKETGKQNKALTKQNKLLKKRLQLKKDAFDATQTIGEQEQEQLKEIIKLQEIAAEKELQIQLEIAANKPEEVNVDELERLLNERYDLIKRALEDERDLMLLNEELTQEERDLIDIQFKNKLAENERNRVKTVDDANNEIIDAQIETSEKVAEIQTDGNEKVLDNDKKLQEQRLTALRSFAQKAIEIANAKTDKEIENVDKELSANKKRQDELQQLAAQGNLTAEQSVSAEIKRELELERQKEALEKKKARRQIILEGLDLLSSKIDGGEKDAVTSTLNDMTRLLGALAALPGFIDGTETTVGAALGKPQL